MASDHKFTNSKSKHSKTHNTPALWDNDIALFVRLDQLEQRQLQIHIPWHFEMILWIINYSNRRHFLFQSDFFYVIGFELRRINSNTMIDILTLWILNINCLEMPKLKFLNFKYQKSRKPYTLNNNWYMYPYSTTTNAITIKTLGSVLHWHDTQ